MGKIVKGVMTDGNVIAQIDYKSLANLPTIDATIIDGSKNAVQGNAVYDAISSINTQLSKKLDATNGKAADSEKLGGKSPEHYVSQADLQQFAEDMGLEVDANTGAIESLSTLLNTKLDAKAQAVDSAKLNGQGASYYATKTAVDAAQKAANDAQTTANSAMSNATSAGTVANNANTTANTVRDNIAKAGNVVTSHFAQHASVVSNTPYEITVFTAPETGMYFMEGYANYGMANTTGYRLLKIDVAMGEVKLAPIANTDQWVTQFCVVYCAAGQEIKMILKQTSGDTLDTTYGFRYSYIKL